MVIRPYIIIVLIYLLVAVLRMLNAKKIRSYLGSHLKENYFEINFTTLIELQFLVQLLKELRYFEHKFHDSSQQS